MGTELPEDNISFQNPNSGNNKCPKGQESNKTLRSRSGKRLPWSLNETRDLIRLRAGMDKDFKLNRNKHKPLWENISGVINSMYPSCHRSANVCCDKWKNTRREYLKLKNSGKPIEDYFKIVDMIENTKTNDPPEAIRVRSKPVTWTLAETRMLVECRIAMDPKFRNCARYHKDLWQELSIRLHAKLNLATSDKTPSVCREKWRCMVKEYKLMKIEGRPIRGFMAQIIAENCTCIVIQYGTQKYQIAIFESARAEDIKFAIKSVCRLQNQGLNFWLEDQNGIAQPIDKSIPGNKLYNLHRVRGPCE